MPYIKKEDRHYFKWYIESLIHDIETEGELNYVITKLCIGFLGECPSYHMYNSIMGVLECVKQEFYRRAMVKYEEEKIKEHGDVY